MRLRTLLETEALGLRLLGGRDQLDHTVRTVMTTDLKDPGRYLNGGELVLTGLAWRRRPEDSETFVRALADAGVAALAAGEAELGQIPEDLVLACARYRLPLFAVDERVAFAEITEHVARQVSAARSADLAILVERHRRLVSAEDGGGGPEAVLALLLADLDLRAWVLGPTGRWIAGTAGTLPAALRAELAGEHHAAQYSGRPVPYRTRAGGRLFSLFPILPGVAAPGTPALPSWLLAVEADAGEWAGHRVELVHGVTRLIAAERERQEAAAGLRRRLAGEVLELLRYDAAPAEVAARLRVVAAVLLPGLGSAPQWQVVVAGVSYEPDAAGRADKPPDGRNGGSVAQLLLEEILGEGVAGADPAGKVAVAQSRNEATALVPLPAVTGQDSEDGEDGGDSGDSGPGMSAERLLERLGPALALGLGDGGRLTIGVSATVHSVQGLRGALEEARHARRVAAARPGRVCVVGLEELTSHALLLPFVPDDVRGAFTARLLDPLRAYDRRHRAELIPTLEAFLNCDGSWTRCAAQLHLHVNTLRYRIGRIEQLTGRDLSRVADKVDFFLALRMR